MQKGLKKLLISTACVNILIPSLSYAGDLSPNVRKVINTKVSAEQKAELIELLNSNKLPSKRPEFCPLNNTQSYKKTADSLKSIIAIFKDDCFDGNQAVIDQIVNSSKELEGQLNELAKTQGKDETNVVETVQNMDVAGVPVSQVMSGIDTLFNKKSCSNLDKTPFLQRSADVIQTFSQFGLYTPAGAPYAYGGLAVASILRFVDSIFSQRFEFENDADIQTFIKLNCAYYDVRNQIKEQQIFELDTKSHYKDKELISELLSDLESTKKSLDKAKKEMADEISKRKTAHISSVEKDLEKTMTKLFVLVKDQVANKPGKSAKYQQAEIIGELSYDIDNLLVLLDSYIQESNGADRFLNQLFKSQLEKLKSPGELMSLSVKEFNETFLIDVASSFKRVLNSIEGKRASASSTFTLSTAISIDGTEYSYKDLNSILTGDDLKKREKELNETIEKAKNLDARLERIVSRNEYSSQDSKDGGTREIIKSLDIVKNHIFGKYGKQFLDKMRSLSMHQNKNFEKSYNDFSQKYLKDGQIRAVDTLTDDTILNACVDAQTNREIWVYSQKLTELGYDFISTNNDVFGNHKGNKTRKSIKKHSDSVVLARRVISAENYLKKLQNYQDLGRETISIEGKDYPIDQAESVIKTIDFYGKKLSLKEAKSLLDKKYGPKLGRIRKLGYVMLDVMKNRNKAVRLQNLYKSYNCSTAGTLKK